MQACHGNEINGFGEFGECDEIGKNFVKFAKLSNLFASYLNSNKPATLNFTGEISSNS